MDDVVLIKKPECLHCIHLLGNQLGEKEYDCHDDKWCPARYFQITIGADIEGYAKKLYKAKENTLLTGDQSGLLDLLSELSDTMDIKVVQMIHERARGIELSREAH